MFVGHVGQSYGVELPKAKLLRLMRLGRVVRLFTALKELQKILNAVYYAMSHSHPLLTRVLFRNYAARLFGSDDACDLAAHACGCTSVRRGLPSSCRARATNGARRSNIESGWGLGCFSVSARRNTV